MFRLRFDPYILLLLTTVGVAALLPARGIVAVECRHATTIAIGLLFFLYGARLSTRAAVAGLRHWRLHVLVLTFTFLVFPLLGLMCRVLVPGVLTPELYAGVMFLCCLPSTVQSSIAFTSIARGNVAAAICSASFSNLIGIVLTPALVTVFLVTQTGGAVSLAAIRDILLQLLVPFVAGQLLQKRIGGLVVRHKKVLGYVDRGSILLVVYAAFSAGVVAGIWSRLSATSLVFLFLTNAALLGIVIVSTMTVARRLRFTTEDQIAIVFCGSKKSLASGLPLASVLLPAATAGLMVVPLMMFHQMQLMVCAWLARRYGARRDAAASQQISPTNSRAQTDLPIGARGSGR
jgi:solute carrier family 10 (sodium/bile acid cotransporter), member 7